MKIWNSVLFLAICTYLQGDIAPVIDTATLPHLKPSENVRLDTADINIYWGNPSIVNGSFRLYSENVSSQDLTIIFPTTYYAQSIPSDYHDRYDFEISINGDLPKEIPVTSREHKNGTPYDVFEREFRLIPKENLIRVKHNVFPCGRKRVIENKALYDCQGIFYTMWTGSFWKGPIKKETVTVWFPDTSYMERINHELTSPEGYTIGENYVRWTFSNIEPKDSDDISLTLYKHNQSGDGNSE